MTSEKFKVNYILSWIMLYIGFQLSILFMNKSNFYLDDSGNIISAAQIAKDNPLLAFTSHTAVLMAFGIVFLFWGLFLNLNTSYKRSKYQENSLKLWKIVIAAWISLLILPLILIALLTPLSPSLITEKMAMQIPFMVIALFIFLQVIGLRLGIKNTIFKHV